MNQNDMYFTVYFESALCVLSSWQCLQWLMIIQVTVSCEVEVDQGEL
jgi:hypothetical protein